MSYLSKLKPHKNQKRVKQSFKFSLLTYNRICVFDITVHKAQGCMGIELDLLPSAAKVKQSALVIKPLRYVSERNNEKYIARLNLCYH